MQASDVQASDVQASDVQASDWSMVVVIDRFLISTHYRVFSVRYPVVFIGIRSLGLDGTFLFFGKVDPVCRVVVTQMA
jgi:hypothetical protein